MVQEYAQQQGLKQLLFGNNLEGERRAARRGVMEMKKKGRKGGEGRRKVGNRGGRRRIENKRKTTQARL